MNFIELKNLSQIGLFNFLTIYNRPANQCIHSPPPENKASQIVNVGTILGNCLPEFCLDYVLCQAMNLDYAAAGRAIGC
jgi:hypothetical protein